MSSAYTLVPFNATLQNRTNDFSMSQLPLALYDFSHILGHIASKPHVAIIVFNDNAQH